MGRKKKRPQEATTTLSLSSSLRSTSYRQDSVSPATTSTANQVKTANVGCMSGIFHLMSKYHTRRKFLTFGKKQERDATIKALPPAPEKNPPTKPEIAVTCKPREHDPLAGRLSLDQVPRSPAIPSEIRRSSTDSLASSPRVVARLMGLEDIPATPPPPPTAALPAAEKRRKLLGALEKCDEDLKALKKIIEAVRATQTPPRGVEMEGREEAEERESEVGSDEPSPVSVLDHHCLSSNYSKRSQNEQMMHHQHLHKPIKQQKQQMTRKKPGDHEDKAINCLNKPTFSVPQPLHLPARRNHQLLNHSTTTYAAGTPWSTAMKESVIEVCRDVEWGQQQEVRSIGLILQDFMLRELIDEITRELGSKFHAYRTCKLLPFEACKRRLSF